MRKFTLVALLAAAFAGQAHAQAASIDPGMTKDQVIARLGKPSSEHSSGSSTYLYYPNGQEKKVGMSDMVALQDGKVVDAVFRSSSRKYSGKSSSPAAISTEDAVAKGNGGKAPPMRMPVAATAPETRKTSAAPAKSTDTKKTAPPSKAPETKKAVPPAKGAETKKSAPPAKATDTKKVAPPAKAPETKKVTPPTSRMPEPLIKTGAKKIQAPPKSTDTSKKAAPAPAKKP
jgi:hypothetical protein